MGFACISVFQTNLEGAKTLARQYGCWTVILQLGIYLGEKGMRVGGVLVVIVSYGRDFVLVLPTELDFYLT
jgi:hypothetical protein